MVQFAKAVLAIVVSCLVLYGESSYIGYETWWLTVLICIICVYSIIYTGSSYHMEERAQTKEFIINLQDDTVEEEFKPADYPEYHRKSSGKDGNDYVSPSGGVICTKYVTRKEPVRVSDGLANHILCIMVAGLAALCWSAIIKQGQALDIIRIHAIRIMDNFMAMKTRNGSYLVSCITEQLRLSGQAAAETIRRIGGNIVQVLNDFTSII